MFFIIGIAARDNGKKSDLMNLKNFKRLSLETSASLSALLIGMQVSVALPPPEDIPEEVLRTEIVTEARSPLDGQPLTAAEYAQLEAQLAQSPFPPEISSNIEQLIFLLNLRKLFTILIPF
jgi:hypothetical protein